MQPWSREGKGGGLWEQRCRAQSSERLVGGSGKLHECSGGFCSCSSQLEPSQLLSPAPSPHCLCLAGESCSRHKGRLFCTQLGRQRWRGGSFQGTLFYSCLFEEEAPVLQTAYTGWSLAGSSLQFFPKAMLLHSSPIGFTCIACSSFREMTDSAEGTGA